MMTAKGRSTDTTQDQSAGRADQRWNPTRSSSDRSKPATQPRLTEDALCRHNDNPKQDENDLKRSQEGHTVALRELRRLGVDVGDDLAHKVTPVGQGMAPMERFIEELDGHASSSRAAWVTHEYSASSRGATKASSNKSG